MVGSVAEKDGARQKGGRQVGRAGGTEGPISIYRYPISVYGYVIVSVVSACP